MKTAFSKFALFLITAIIFAGCAGHPPRRTSATINGLPSSTIGLNQTFTLTGTCNDDRSNGGVSWTLTGAGSFTCTTSTFIYTAPGSVPENPVVTVTATCVSTPTAFATVTFTISAGTVSVNITNPISNATAGSTTNIILNATVANDVNSQGVTWQLVTGGTTTACSPSCGTIVASTSTSFTYLPPATVPTNPSTSIIATSVADTSQSATDTFTIQAATAPVLSFLTGPFAFEAGGFDASGNALTIAGSFTADGNGNITSGEVDVNDNLALTHSATVAGTYTLDSNLRGIITFSTAMGNAFSTNPTFAFTIDSATNTGTIVSVDEAEQAVSGLLAAQNPAVFSATPSGNFIFRGTSDAGGVRMGAVGRFTVGAGGVFSNGIIDSADIGQGNDNVNDPLSGTFEVADSAGRGLLEMGADQSNEATGAFAYYAVSANKIFIIEIGTDVPGQFVDVARSQSALSASSVNGTGVFGLIGADDGADPTEDQIASATIGQLVITSGTTASIVCDVNDAAVITFCSTNGETPTAIPGTVTFDPTTGRGTLTIANGFNNGFVDSATFYLEANGAGVMMDTTEPSDSGLPEALVGDLIPQTSTAEIAGQVQGVGLTGDNEAFAIAGVFNITDDEAVTGLFDGSSPDEDPIFDSSVTGTAGNTDLTGRTDLQVSGEIFGGVNQPAGSFSASPNRYFVIVEADEVETDLGIFTPQTLPPAQPDVKTKVKSNAKTGPTPKLRSRKLNPAVAAKHQRRNAAKVHPKTITPRQQQ